MLEINQLVIGASPGDAITSMAFNLRQAFRAHCKSDVYGVFIDESLSGDVLPFSSLNSRDPRQILIYHSSYGLAEVTKFLTGFLGRIVLNYHNITPPEFFEKLDREFASGLRWGRVELEVLRTRIEVAYADSTFNAQELAAIGYQTVKVNPAGLRAGQYVDIPLNLNFAEELTERFPFGFVVAISQLLPHKNVHEVVSAVHYLRMALGSDVGLVVVGVRRSIGYSESVGLYAAEMLGDRCWITGRLTDQEVSTALKQCLAYVSMSMHEGLSLPLLESMSLGVPSIVRDIGAISETAGSGSVLLPRDAGPIELAEQIERTLTDPEHRQQLTGRGLSESTRFDVGWTISDYVAEIVGLLP